MRARTPKGSSGGKGVGPVPASRIALSIRSPSRADYRRGEDIYPGFTHYRRWAANRQIPVLRLEPLS